MKALKVVLVWLLVLIMTAQIPAPPTNLIGAMDGTPIVGGGQDAYCSPSGTWIGPTIDGPSKLPIQCMPTSMKYTPSPGAIHGPFTTYSALQAAVNTGACGDKYLVQMGSDLGINDLNFPQKNCPDTAWNLIETTGVSDPRFPPEGTRMTPCWSGVQSMPNRTYSCPNPAVLTFKISAANASNAMSTQTGGDHWIVLGAEITRDQSGGKSIYNLVDLGSQNNTLNQAHHIIFARSWFHGVPFTGPASIPANDTSTTRAIYLAQTNHVAVIDSYFTDFYDTTAMSANGNTDAQCIGGGSGGVANSGWGVYKWYNNHCEASGEGVLLGGSGGPQLTPAGCTIMVNCNLDVPTDIDARQNYFFKPPQWNTSSGTGWPVLKNGFEMKIGARVLFEGNVIENAPYGSQVGWCWTTAPKNQSNGGNPSVATAPTALTNDFTYRFNMCGGAATGPGLYATMDGGCNNCQTQGANGYSMHDNVIDAMIPMACCGADAYITTTVSDSTNQGLNRIQNVNISNNTFVRSSRYSIAVGAGGSGLYYTFVMQNNLFPNAQYGVGSNPSLAGCSTTNSFFQILGACMTGWTVDHNAVFEWPSNVAAGASWPTDGKGTGNWFYCGTGAAWTVCGSNPPTAVAGFVNYGTGDSNFTPTNYALDPNSPLHNAGSNGRDIGADTQAVANAINGVRV